MDIDSVAHKTNGLIPSLAMLITDAENFWYRIFDFYIADIASSC